VIELRLPDLADAHVLHSYTTVPGGLSGSWVPLRQGASLQTCAALVGDWLAGWRNDESFYGLALVMVPSGENRLVGQVGLGDLGDDVVELVYGVAPDHGGRGFASHAARLVGRWLVDDDPGRVVELRIGADHVESQRVATRAGFVRAGTIVSDVASTGETFDDLHYVMRAG
jgi:RimJ/RimL family protein N-acetyltransferase